MRRIYTLLFLIAFTPHLVLGNIALTQLQRQKAQLISNNQALKTKNKELIKQRDKFKKQKKIFGVTTALGVGGTLGTSIFAIKNKGDKKTAINQTKAAKKSLAESIVKAKEEAKKTPAQNTVVIKSVYQLEEMKGISHLFFIDAKGEKIDLIQGEDLVCADQIIGNRSCQLCTTENLNHLFCETERWTPEKGVSTAEFFGGEGWAYKEGSYWKIFKMHKRKYFSDQICENNGNLITSLKKVKEGYGIKNSSVRFLLNEDAGLMRTTVDRGKFLVRYTPSGKTDIFYEKKIVKENVYLEKKIVVSKDAKGRKTYTACPSFVAYGLSNVFGLSFFDKNSGPVFIVNNNELTKGLSGYKDIMINDWENFALENQNGSWDIFAYKYNTGRRSVQKINTASLKNVRKQDISGKSCLVGETSEWLYRYCNEAEVKHALPVLKNWKNMSYRNSNRKKI